MDVAVDSPPDASLLKPDIDLFDPLAGRNVGGEDDSEYSNAWLLSTMPICDTELPRETDKTDALLDELEKELVSSNSDTNFDTGDTNVDNNDTVPPAVVGETFASTGLTNADYADGTEGSSDAVHKGRSRSSSTVECGKGDLVISPVHAAPSSVGSVVPPPGGPSPTRSQTKRSEVGSSSSRHHQGLVTVDLKQKADYIFQAAHHISLALQCEASANYFMAFNYYKSGVGILLTGVQRK